MDSKKGVHPFIPEQRAFKVLVLNGKKFVRKYIVISDSIPKNMKDLNLPDDYGEFLEAQQLNYEVIIK